MQKGLLLLIFSIISIFGLKAQNVEETLRYGHIQYANRQFDEAIQSYRRVLFFDPTKGKDVYLSLAYAYWEAYQDWKKSIYYFDLAYQVTTDPKKQESIIFTKAQLYLLAERYTDVQLELASMDEETWDLKTIQRKRFYQGVASYQLQNYDKSEGYFIECVNDSSSKAEIHNWFVHYAKQKHKFRPQKIQIMSIVVPGLGQMYCGDWKAGINSFLLTGGLLTGFVYASQVYTLLDGFLTVLPWFQRYYTGGYKKAKNIAKHRIEDERKETYQGIITTIRNSKKE